MDKLRSRQAELISILESLNQILKNKDWQVLEELLWSKRTEQLDRLLLAEAKKKDLDLGELKYLNGRRDEAKKYSNLQEYGESLVKELETIKLKLNK